jgi:hypothetical protein
LNQGFYADKFISLGRIGKCKNKGKNEEIKKIYKLKIFISYPFRHLYLIYFFVFYA